MSHSLAACIYAEQLRMHRLGEPLWQPDPPTEDGEVLIGDVGFIEDGRFYRLFNARLPANHPINSVDGVPEGFVPLEYNERGLLKKNESYLDPTPLVSKSVSKNEIGAGGGAKGAYASYKFTCVSEKGAVLLPGDNIAQWHVQPNDSFPEYIRLNHDSWHDFARAQGRIIAAEDIILVTGFLKTSEWAVASISKFSKTHGVSFSAQGVPVAQAQFTLEHNDAVEVSVSQRSGPKRTDSLSGIHSSRRDQCLFLKYYKAKRKLLLGRKLVANAEPKDDRESGDYNEIEGLEVEEVSSSESWNDPLGHALDYILEHSSAEMAIVGHDEVYGVCGDTEAWPDDFDTFLQMDSKPAIYLDETSVGYLQNHKYQPSSPLSIVSKPVSTSYTKLHDLPNTSSPTTPVDRKSVHHRGSYMLPSSPSSSKDPKRLFAEPSWDDLPPPYFDDSAQEVHVRSVYTVSNTESVARAHSSTWTMPAQSPTPSVMMHWQLLPPNISWGRHILFDMAFSVRRIHKFVRGEMKALERDDRNKPAAANTNLTTMVIICAQLSPYKWRLTVEKPSGITCGDVLEGLYQSMNTALTPQELELFITENDRIFVEDAFAERCEALAGQGIDVSGEVKRWIDLLHGCRFFAGLKGGKDNVWVLQVAEPIYQ